MTNTTTANTRNAPQAGKETSASACCGGPAPGGVSACCAQDAEVKSAGGAGCGCGPARPAASDQARPSSGCCA
jgi:hypothetical protein